MTPLTLPVAALRLMLAAAWREGVDAGARRGSAAHDETDHKVEEFLSRLIQTAYDLARKDAQDGLAGSSPDGD
jgi:hypothetical protein